MYNRMGSAPARGLRPPASLLNRLPFLVLYSNLDGVPNGLLWATIGDVNGLAIDLLYICPRYSTTSGLGLSREWAFWIIYLGKPLIRPVLIKNVSLRRAVSPGRPSGWLCLRE